MKRLLTIAIILLSVLTSNAHEDRFSDISQIKGKDIYVTDNSALNVAFTIIDGKVKPIRKCKNLNISMDRKVYSVEKEVYTFKKNTYVVLKNAEETILLKLEDAPLYLSSFISKTYWQEKYDLYRNDYVYMDIKKYNKVHSVHATVVYDDLSRVEWQNFDISDKGTSFIMREYNGVIPLENIIVPSKFFEDNKDVYFIKKDDIQPYVEKYNNRLAKEKREKEVKDSIDNCKLRLAVALREANYMVGDREINVNTGDTLAIFSYDTDEEEYVARFRMANLLFKPDAIEFLDTKKTTTPGRYSWESTTVKSSADADFLIAKGEEGKEQRFLVAEEFEEVQTKKYIEKLISVVNDYKRDVAYKKKNQIFITGIGYDYDNNKYSNRFGMFFDIYNCFSKTIKYVELTLTNYNAVGDVQRDDVGHSSRTVRGIGPITPEDGGRYSWDDIFWDDRNVISKTKLTNVKFIFTDGTTKVFSGSANINKHMTSDAWQ